MNEHRTTETLSERSEVVRIGLLPIISKPLTLLQVQELGEIAEQMGEDDPDPDQLLSDYAFHNSRAAKLLSDAIVVSLFRRRLSRWLFGGYVRRHLNSNAMRRCMARIRGTFDFGFFFNSTIFLRGMRRKRTAETSETLRGDSWVES